MASGTATVPSDTKLFVRYRKLALFAYLTTAFMAPWLEDLPRAPLVMAFSAAVCSVFWCVADAFSRGRNYDRSLQWHTMFLWPIFVPAYMIRTRGIRGVLLVILYVVLYVASATAGFGFREMLYAD